MSFDYKFWVGIIFAALTPIGLLVMKINSDISEVKTTQISIKETQQEHKGYVRESKASSNEAMIALTLIFEQNKRTSEKLDVMQVDITSLREEQRKVRRDIYKLYKANPILKDPSLNSELTFR